MARAPLDDDPELRAVLMADPRLAPILSDRRYRAQVLVTEVCPAVPSAPAVTATTTGDAADDAAHDDATKHEPPPRDRRGAAGAPGQDPGGQAARAILKRRGFRADAEYFYPASAVKLMGAAAACLKLQQIARRHSSTATQLSSSSSASSSSPASPARLLRRRRKRFHLDLDTPLVFEPRGLVPSIADSRAKTDRALRTRDRLIKLAEQRLEAMEREWSRGESNRGESNRGDGGGDGGDGTSNGGGGIDEGVAEKGAGASEEDGGDEAAAAVKRRRLALRDEPEDFDVAAAAETAAAVVVDRDSAARIAADLDTFVAAYVASSISDDDVCASYGGEGLRGDAPPPGCSAPTTLASELRKLFLVSDNEAFNRCYDIAGPTAINRWANGSWDKGDRDDDEEDYDVEDVNDVEEDDDVEDVNDVEEDDDVGEEDEDDEDCKDEDDRKSKNADESDGGGGDIPGCAVRHRLFSAATDLDNAAYLPAVWAEVTFFVSGPAAAQATKDADRDADQDADQEDAGEDAEEWEEGEARWVRILPARTDPSVDDPRHPKVSDEKDDEGEGNERDSDEQGEAAAAADEMRVGTAHIAPSGVKVDAPLDCSTRNRVTLATLQEALVRIARPDLAVVASPATAAAAAAAREELCEPHRRFLLDVMSRYPRQSSDPVYCPTTYPDHFGKFFLRGLTRVAPQASLAVANKLGRAYGFSVDNAYVSSLETGRAFFLAASVETNANGVVNDDAYEYEDVADPFLENLAEVVAKWLWAA